MAEEIKQEENENQIPERLLKTPKVYSKSTASPQRIEDAKQEYIENVRNAYSKLHSGKISDSKFKELLRAYRVDFDLSTRGRRYLKMVQLHNKGKIIKSTKLFDFGCFALYKEKTQKSVALLKDNEILYRQAKATRDNAIYLSDQIEIDKYENSLLEIKLQLKYDIDQYKIEGDFDKIAEAKQVAKERIAELKENVALQKQRNKEFYELIKNKRVVLAANAKKEYKETSAKINEELHAVKQIKTTTLKEKLEKNQKLRNIRCKQQEARDIYKYNMYIAKNFHPAWVSDPDIKSMFRSITENRVKRYQVIRSFDDRIDTLKIQFIERLETEKTMSVAKRNRIYRMASFRAWYRHAGAKIVGMLTMALIVVFSILGLIDSIPATSFLLTKYYVGSISIFIFIALMLFSIWVIFKIIELVRRKAGVYDVVEARFSKEDAATSAIGLSSKSSADEFEYLDELFTKGEKEVEKAREEIESQGMTATQQKIISTVVKEEGKWDKEVRAERVQKRYKAIKKAKAARMTKKSESKEEAAEKDKK